MAVSHSDKIRTSCVATALEEGGLWPADAGRLVLPTDVNKTFGRDLIPILLRGWAPAGNMSDKIAAWLDDQQGRGAALTLGYDSHFDPVACTWLGLRLAWWPDGIPRGRRIGLASSRLGRRLDSQQGWFAVLRAACAKIDRRRDILLTATDTAAAALVQRAAALFNLPLICIETSSDDQLTLGRWLANIIQQASTAGGVPRVVLSPPLTGAPPADVDVVACAPSRDRALVALSDRLLVFHVHRSGRWKQLLKFRLADKSWPRASVYVAVGRQMVTPRCTSELMDAGAVGWVVPAALNVDANENAAQRKKQTDVTSVKDSKCIAIPPSDGWEHLTHHTRHRDGAWPGQHEDEYLNDLILQRDEADHSPLAALRRIISTRRLLSSRDAIRGGTAVVCFTAVPLAELRHRRVFRSHRARWDFEPYGICIRREWLEQQGARPVQYGNDDLWAALPPEEQPFFQTRQTRGKGQVTDWTAEEEWRHAGDVQLDQIPEHAAFVFVPTALEAEQIADESPWPVVVVGDFEEAEPAAQIRKPR